MPNRFLHPAPAPPAIPTACESYPGHRREEELPHSGRGTPIPAAIPEISRPAPFRANAPRLARLLLLAPVFLLLTSPLLLPSLGHAQTTFIISGTITSALDNHPIQHATVELLTAGNDVVTPQNDTAIETTTSDELGHFTFPAVPKGAFALRGESSGFVPSLFQQHGAFSTAIITGSTVPTDAIKLALQPLGSISGTVTDEFSEPVRNATIHLYRRDDSFGDNRLASATQIQTDDLGHYDIGRLTPGTYFLAVTASPWYAIHPTAFAQPLVLGVVPYRDPTLDVAYPVTYFPAGYDAAHASPIQIHGNQARADVQLTPAPAITLTFPRDPKTPGAPLPQLQASVFGHPTFAGTQSEQGPDSASISGLAPGDYTLRTSVAVPIPGGQGIRYQAGSSTPLHLTRDTPAALPLPTTNLAEVHITVRSADGDALPNNLQLHLAPATSSPADTQPRPFAAPSKPHQFDIESEPGDFYLSLTGAPAFFLREISINNKPLPSNDLHLARGDSITCTVVLARGTHTLRGLVQSTTRPLSAAMLLLIPADQHLPPRTWYRQQSDLDGSFSIANVPPGPYLLLALDEPAWLLDWRSSAFLSRHLPHATPVLVPEKPPTEVDLPQPITIQPL